MSHESDIAATHTWAADDLEAATLWPPGAHGQPANSDPALRRPSPLPQRYQDLGPLAEGGMSELRRVRDTVLGAELAMKILAWRFVEDTRNRQVFLAEAKATAQLQHPGIVAVQDCGELDDGRLWFTMSIVRGDTLDELADQALGVTTGAGEGRWTRRRVLGVLQQVCDIVAFAHSEGAVHRDLKPSNVMVGRFGEVRVMDWGLATVPGVDHPYLKPGMVVGTPAYMAPEQARGESATPSTDVYALGGMLYRILAGSHPRSGPVRRVVQQAAIGASPRLADDLPDVPKPLRELCHACLTRDASARPTAAGVSAELASWLEGAQRQREALALVDAARAERPTLRRLVDQARELRLQASDLLDQVQADDPVDAKKPAWELQDRADALEAEATLREVTWTQDLRAALNRAPDLPEAHELLADHYRDHLQQAEDRRDALSIARYEALLRSHDRGRHAAYLRGDGALTLHTSRPAHARLHRIVEKDRRLVPVLERDLGPTPLTRVRLGRGSWLVSLHTHDGVEVRYPVFIERGAHWDGVAPGQQDPFPIWIPRPGELGPQDCYVPAGYCVVGGDPDASDGLERQRVWVDGFVMQRFPVTLGKWRDWLQRLTDSGQHEQVQACRPRTRRETAFLLIDDGTVRVAEPYLVDQPVSGVDHATASLFAASRGARLPTGLEFEKAGRGVDGRFTPWGDELEPRWSRVAQSFPRPASIVSIRDFATDESVYGVRGLAGNVRTWCANWWSASGPITDGRADAGPDEGTHRAVRGGAFNGPTRVQRLAIRYGDPPGQKLDSLGLQLCRPVSALTER